MKYTKNLIWFSSILFLYGCATVGTTVRPEYQEANNNNKITNEKIVGRPYDAAWDNLVKGISKSFYVINNIDKESRIINISFSSDSPEKYIDCGKTHRTYARGNDKEDYIYNVASSSSYRVAGKAGDFGQFPVTGYVNRKSSLEGRINVYVAPETSGTNAAVNVKYLFTVKTSGHIVTENVFGTTINQQTVPEKSSTLSFNTNQENKVNWGTATDPAYVSCYSTGKIENEILSLIY